MVNQNIQKKNDSKDVSILGYFSEIYFQLTLLWVVESPQFLHKYIIPPKIDDWTDMQYV